VNACAVILDFGQLARRQNVVAGVSAGKRESAVTGNPNGDYVVDAGINRLKNSPGCRAAD
jgi:hypothetical protein